MAYSLYFIRPRGETGPVKIGISATPEKRLAQLQPHSPLPLELVCAVAGGPGQELILHNMFAADRLHGEWFSHTAELGRVIGICLERGELPDDLPPIPPTERNSAIIAAYKSGQTLHKIAADFGVTAPAVWAILVRHDVPRRKTGRWPGGAQRVAHKSPIYAKA
jgi:hypothetical protein